MTPFEAFRLYTALKLHFNSNYDFFRYRGGVKSATENSFETRNDRYYFHKLSKRKDLQLFLANSFYLKPNLWVGDLFDEKYEKNHIESYAVIQSLEYNIKETLSYYDSFSMMLEGRRPSLFRDFHQGKVSKELMIVLQDHLKYFTYWDKLFGDDILWEHHRERLNNFNGFFDYDKEKIKKLLFTFF